MSTVNEQQLAVAVVFFAIDTSCGSLTVKLSGRAGGTGGSRGGPAAHQHIQQAQYQITRVASRHQGQEGAQVDHRQDAVWALVSQVAAHGMKWKLNF